jgi:hypothetical protein
LCDAFTQIAKFWNQLKKETAGIQHFVAPVITTSLMQKQNTKQMFVFRVAAH